MSTKVPTIPGDQLDALTAGDGLTLVDFSADWCGPCRVLAPVLDQLADELAERLRIVKIDVDADPATAARFRVRGIPSLVFVRGGREIGRLTGAYPKAQLRRAIDDVLQGRHDHAHAHPDHHP